MFGGDIGYHQINAATFQLRLETRHERLIMKIPLHEADAIDRLDRKQIECKHSAVLAHTPNSDLTP